MIIHEFQSFKSTNTKQPTFDTIESSLLSVDRSFSILLNDSPWIFDGSWLNICYLSGNPSQASQFYLPQRILELLEESGIYLLEPKSQTERRQAAKLELKITSLIKCIVKMPTTPANFCSGASGWDTRPTTPNWIISVDYWQTFRVSYHAKAITKKGESQSNCSNIHWKQKKKGWPEHKSCHQLHELRPQFSSSQWHAQNPRFRGHIATQF